MNCIKLSRDCALKSLKGLEFFSGIPGTVGGAVRMNVKCMDAKLLIF